MWCPFGYPGHFPPDERAEDGLSLTFTSPQLEGHSLELLGSPEVTLTLAADRPQALVAVRLCDVAPDGASTLVTRGLLNLTHRHSHEHPAPLVPGRRYVVTVRPNAIGWAVPAGHRLRSRRLAGPLAVRPWPSPERGRLAPPLPPGAAAGSLSPCAPAPGGGRAPGARRRAVRSARQCAGPADGDPAPGRDVAPDGHRRRPGEALLGCAARRWWRGPGAGSGSHPTGGRRGRSRRRGGADTMSRASREGESMRVNRGVARRAVLRGGAGWGAAAGSRRRRPGARAPAAAPGMPRTPGAARIAPGTVSRSTARTNDSIFASTLAGAHGAGTHPAAARRRRKIPRSRTLQARRRERRLTGCRC